MHFAMTIPAMLNASQFETAELYLSAFSLNVSNQSTFSKKIIAKQLKSPLAPVDKVHVQNGLLLDTRRPN